MYRSLGTLRLSIYAEKLDELQAMGVLFVQLDLLQYGFDSSCFVKGEGRILFTCRRIVTFL